MQHVLFFLWCHLTENTFFSKVQHFLTLRRNHKWIFPLGFYQCEPNLLHSEIQIKRLWAPRLKDCNRMVNNVWKGGYCQCRNRDLLWSLVSPPPRNHTRCWNKLAGFYFVLLIFFPSFFCNSHFKRFSHIWNSDYVKGGI